ncbi:hypothetical protein KSP39_PZI007179 [Platanthera zijinensis]|uniref:Uncharacterized protein n=1 Tax=Platanthera zijinensis TaxID=2320716 RepID=A0AAP0BQ24_9ASPA
MRRAPTLRLHFAGNTSLWLKTRNYFFEFESEGERVLFLNADVYWLLKSGKGGRACSGRERSSSAH